MKKISFHVQNRTNSGMDILSIKAEFDQEKQEKYVNVRLFDNELDEFREALTWDVQNYRQRHNPKDKDAVKKLHRKEKALNEINICWRLANPS